MQAHTLVHKVLCGTLAVIEFCFSNISNICIVKKSVFWTSLVRHANDHFVILGHVVPAVNCSVLQCSVV